MAQKPHYDELVRRVAQLEEEAGPRKRQEKINTALYRISNAINTTSNLDELFHSIHQALGEIIDTTNFFIALYDRNEDRLSFPYIVDTVDEFYPTVLKVSKTASLTAEIIQSGKSLMVTKKEILEQREASNLAIPSCTPSEIWLGVPLSIEYQIIGAMVVQSYVDPHCFDKTDMQVMEAVADQAALALHRKRIEEELQKSEENFRRIVSTAFEGILSVDADWKITYANIHLAEMFGFNAPEELIGKSFEEFFFEEDRVDFSKKREERSRGITSRFERRFKKRDNSEIWTIVSATALIDNDGEFAGSFGMITDITARKNAEVALQEKIAELHDAIDQIKTLRGIVPICSHCKKIRDDQGYWNQLEVYVKEHTEAEFSHGLCPQCLDEHYSEYI